MTEKAVFHMKEFDIRHVQSTMKVGIDAVLLGSWVSVPRGSCKVLDVGTGCGVIALMLAQRSTVGQIWGVEIDAASAREAADNFDRCNWSNRLQVVHIPIQSFVQQSVHSFDLIVCNPPFFSGGTLSDNIGRQGARHAIKLSHQDLLGAARDLLESNGKLAVILPYLEGMRLTELAKNYGLELTRRATVSSKRETKPIRLLLEFSPNHEPVRDESFHLYDDDVRWSSSLWNLTKDFYTHRPEDHPHQ